ncbi:DUF4105 domain-containing protein [bacterium]|nr:DUF4105 domain-containing protein [bacterium]
MYLAAILAGVILFFIAKNLWRPRLDRAWIPLHEKQPRLAITGHMLTIENVRHARYRSEFEYDVTWTTESYGLNMLSGAYFVTEPYALLQAHTFLILDFSGKKVCLSVEVRKTEMKDFKVWHVITNNYEIFYIIADEDDVVKLRRDVRKDPLHYNELNFSTDELRALVNSIQSETNKYNERAWWYRLLHRNCTTEPLRNIRNARPGIPSWSWKYVATTEAEKLLHEGTYIKIGAK